MKDYIITFLAILLIMLYLASDFKGKLHVTPTSVLISFLAFSLILLYLVPEVAEKLQIKITNVILKIKKYFNPETQGFVHIPNYQTSTRLAEYATKPQPMPTVRLDPSVSKKTAMTITNPFLDTINKTAQPLLGNTDTLPMVYNKVIYTNKSRLRGMGDPIRGDIPIAPIQGNWFIPSAASTPHTTLQQGSINVMAGANNETSLAMAKLIYNASKGQQRFVGGVEFQKPETDTEHFGFN
jgi:hypothetical protein